MKAHAISLVAFAQAQTGPEFQSIAAVYRGHGSTKMHTSTTTAAGRDDCSQVISKVCGRDNSFCQALCGSNAREYRSNAEDDLFEKYCKVVRVKDKPIPSVKGACYDHTVYGALNITMVPGLHTDGPVACQSACQATFGCERWTWESPLFGVDPNRCVLKNHEMLEAALCTIDVRPPVCPNAKDTPSVPDVVASADALAAAELASYATQSVEPLGPWSPPFAPCLDYVRTLCKKDVLSCKKGLVNGKWEKLCVFGSALHISGPAFCSGKDECALPPIQCGRTTTPHPTSTPHPTILPSPTATRTTTVPPTSETTLSLHGDTQPPTIPTILPSSISPSNPPPQSTTLRVPLTSTPAPPGGTPPSTKQVIIVDSPTNTIDVTLDGCQGTGCDCADIGLEFVKRPVRVQISY